METTTRQQNPNSPIRLDRFPNPPPESQRGDWTWEMVTRFPRQGEWTEQEYLNFEFDGLVEFVNGVLEFLPVPTFPHQDIVAYLYEKLNAFIGPRTPREVYFAPIRIRMNSGNCREPDVAFIRQNRSRNRKAPAEGADLVMEVVSPEPRDRDRDWIEKRREYAESKIPEYWIVDPNDESITVLSLDYNNFAYKEQGVFRSGEMASSLLLPGFEIEVTECFMAAHGGK